MIKNNARNARDSASLQLPDMEIDAPVGIVRLPKPFGQGAKCTFGPVWGVRNGEKRKRHELCAAVDGDSVNVYNVSYMDRMVLPCRADTPYRLRLDAMSSQRLFHLTCASLLLQYQKGGLRMTKFCGNQALFMKTMGCIFAQ